MVYWSVLGLDNITELSLELHMIHTYMLKYIKYSKQTFYKYITGKVKSYLGIQTLQATIQFFAQIIKFKCFLNSQATGHLTH